MLLGKQVALGDMTTNRNVHQFLPPPVGEVIVCVAINQVTLHCFVIFSLSFNPKCERHVKVSRDRA